MAWTRDNMCASYSVSRVTRRWPLAVFYILMNIAGINSWVIHTINTPCDEPQHRIIFLKNLSLSLMKEHLVSRSQKPSLPRDVSAFLEKKIIHFLWKMMEMASLVGHRRNGEAASYVDDIKNRQHL